MPWPRPQGRPDAVHEMGVVQEVLRAVLESCESAGATRVNIVRITVGELTEIVPEAMQFAWGALTTGTLAEGADLEIRETGGRSLCLQCGTEFDHDRFDRRCPVAECGSYSTKVIVGDELMIDEIDVDVPGGAVAEASAGE
jgi:hydrogenase nickel incorporation protein HypA/HybF